MRHTIIFVQSFPRWHLPRLYSPWWASAFSNCEGFAARVLMTQYHCQIQPSTSWNGGLHFGLFHPQRSCLHYNEQNVLHPLQFTRCTNVHYLALVVHSYSSFWDLLSALCWYRWTLVCIHIKIYPSFNNHYKCKHESKWREVKNKTWKLKQGKEKERENYPHNSQCGPIGLWDVNDPTLSRQLAHRWW
jgi:hypothetical protein